MSLQRWLYLLARLLGDARALQQGRFIERQCRRMVWKQWAKLGREIGL